jgi:hypothetical protein
MNWNRFEMEWSWHSLRYWVQVLSAGTGCRYWVQVLIAGTGCRYWVQVLSVGTQRNYDKLKGYRCPFWDSKPATCEYREVLPPEPIYTVCVGSNLLKSRDSSFVIQNKLCVEDQVIVVRFPDEAKYLARPWAHSASYSFGIGAASGRMLGPFLASRAAMAWITPLTLAKSSILPLLLYVTRQMILILCLPLMCGMFCYQAKVKLPKQ